MSLLTCRLGLHRALASVVLIVPMLAACARSEGAPDGRVPVAVHGVNYTAEEFGYVLIDPLDKENRAGEEAIIAYGAGGTVCCFNLPKQWRPGLKVEVRATKWLPRTPEHVLRSVKQSIVLDLPNYEQGKVAELWVLRTTDDEYSIVISNFQPDHPQWPGKIKGWPVPSVEYLRIIHARVLKEALSDVALSESSLEDLENRPVEHAKEMWEHRMLNEANALKALKGPGDPAFLAMLREEYRTVLAAEREKLKRVKAAQP